MELSIQEIYGQIGEEVCKRYLKLYMDSFVRADTIDFIGTSLLSKEGNSHFDVSNLREVAVKCGESRYCEFLPDRRPCLNSTFYEKNFKANRFAAFFKNARSKKYNNYCAVRNTKVILDTYLDDLWVGNDKFIRDYLICHYFIQNHYYIESRKRRYDSLNEAEVKSFHKYWSGHPGRLDFFGKRGEVFYCIDSKVNSSRLSLWQQVRMAWMQRCGYTSQVYNVHFNCPDNNELRSIYSQRGISMAIRYLEPQLNVIEFEIAKYPGAASIINDEANIINVAKNMFVWIR